MLRQFHTRETVYRVTSGCVAIARAGDPFPGVIAFPESVVIAPKDSYILYFGGKPLRSKADILSTVTVEQLKHSLKESYWYASILKLPAPERIEAVLLKFYKTHSGYAWRNPRGFVVSIAFTELAILCQLSRERVGAAISAHPYIKTENAVTRGIWLSDELTGEARERISRCS